MFDARIESLGVKGTRKSMAIDSVSTREHEEEDQDAMN